MNGSSLGLYSLNAQGDSERPPTFAPGVYRRLARRPDVDVNRRTRDDDGVAVLAQAHRYDRHWVRARRHIARAHLFAPALLRRADIDVHALAVCL